MMSRFKSLRWFFIIIFFAAPAAMAQQTPLEPTRLALEVHFYPNEAPAYQAVSASSRSGAWYARFARVQGWVQPANAPAVTAVNIKSELAEDGVRVWITVFRGELHELENKVNSYVLHEGEKVTVGELSEVGVTPFEIKLVRLNPSVSELPQFASKAKSIEVVVMQPNFSTMPSYDVVVRNLSTKTVNALQVQVLQAGSPQMISMPQGKEGEALIAPGGTYQFSAHLAYQARPGPNGYAPVILPNQVIEVSTAVFADDLFEGDRDAAMAFIAFQKGRKIQLAKVIDLLQKASTATEPTSSAVVASLRNELAMLNLEPDQPAIDEVQSKFPAITDKGSPRLKHLIALGMKGVQDSALKDLVQFELRNRRSDAAVFGVWLASLRDRYQAWFARL
jgi:hypothetical protein